MDHKNLQNITELLTKYDKESLLSDFEEFLQKKYGKKPLSIPVSVFNANLSPFESVVKYLVENKNKGYTDIGKLLRKDRQVIWSTYQRAKKKVSKKFSEHAEIFIPVSALTSDKYSIAELVVAYLKKQDLKNSEIAELLGKDSRTVWTWYNRYKKK